MSIPIEGMMDCVKESFINGVDRGEHFKKMRHAIIVELKRLSYRLPVIKDELREWNNRCERPLSESDVRSQLFKYADWVNERDCKEGCLALKDYCIGEDKCIFYLKKNRTNRKLTEILPFDKSELERFLESKFHANGYIMARIVDVLRYIQLQKATGPIIYVGCREISRLLRDRYQHNISSMEVHRKIHDLEDEGVIKIAEKGKPGTYLGMANGYVLQKWKA